MTLRGQALRADAWMLLASIIWGAAFVAQGKAAAHLDALSIIALRFTVGGLLLLPIALARRSRVRAHSPWPTVALGGTLAGLVMLLAAVLQQRGIAQKLEPGADSLEPRGDIRVAIGRPEVRAAHAVCFTVRGSRFFKILMPAKISRAQSSSGIA